MSSLNNRLYHELDDWKYSMTVFGLFIKQYKAKNKFVNTSMIVLSIIGAIGWYKYDEYGIGWFLLILSIQVIRIFRTYFTKPEEDIFEMKNSQSFYSYNIVDLENLFYSYHNGDLSEKTVEKRYLALRDKERQLFNRQKLETLPDDKKVITKSERLTNTYLTRIKNNLKNG